MAHIDFRTSKEVVFVDLDPWYRWLIVNGVGRRISIVGTQPRGT